MINFGQFHSLYNGTPPPHIPSEESVVNYLIQCNNFGAIKLLIEDPETKTSLDYNRVFRMSAALGNAKMMALLLENPDVDPASDNNYAIKIASEHGYTEVVRLLLAHKNVDPAATDNSAIIDSSRNGHVDIVSMLLVDSRVNPAAEDNMAIKLAVQYGKTAVTKSLMEDARVNMVDESDILSASRDGYVDTVKLLLTHMKPSVACGVTAVKRATADNRDDILAVWLQHFKSDINISTYNTFLTVKMTAKVRNIWRNHLMSHCSATRLKAMKFVFGA